ncbi:hypothetical protein BVX99_01740 [bacterium F16]|nr:hypothetical protein BVX99_01740 [bacterium F16]
MIKSLRLFGITLVIMSISSSCLNPAKEPDAFLNRTDPEVAKVLLQELVEKEKAGQPLPEDYFHERAELHTFLEQYSEAIRWASLGLRQQNSSNKYVLFYLRGDAYFMQKKYRSAKKDYEMVVKLHPAWDNGRAALEEVNELLKKEKNKD